jgi:IclR family KDG regulon transcriptional repressor
MSTVASAFRILEAVVSHQETGLSYSEVVGRTRLPKASAHRVLKSLVQTGYLRFDAEVGRYFGDLKLSFLGAEVISHFDLQRYVRPHLVRLHAATGLACHLGIRSGAVGVYLDKLESASSFGIKLYSEIGKSFPLHCTGMGKALLAGLETRERAAVLGGPLKPFTAHTITQVTRLERELSAVRRLGYAVDREEITRGMMCVAAPVHGRDGRVAAAISLTFPAYVQKDRGIEPEIRAVRSVAAEITAGLGGPGAGPLGRAPAARRGRVRASGGAARRMGVP